MSEYVSSDGDPSKERRGRVGIGGDWVGEPHLGNQPFSALANNNDEGNKRKEKKRIPLLYYLPIYLSILCC